MSVPAEQINAVFSKVADGLMPAQVDPQVGMDVIKKLSQRDEELRFWIETANAFGHHATTISILKQMVDYGFTSPIRILFTNPGDAAKLEMLLPGYKANDAELVYTSPSGNSAQIVFQYGGTPAEPATLLLSGGSDAGQNELKGRLAKANCSYYLQLQPWDWKEDDLLIYAKQDTPTLVYLRHPDYLNPEFRWHAYTQPAVARNDTIWDLYGGLERFKLRVAMAKLIADAQAGKYVMPIYGLERMDMWSAGITLVLGALRAQDLMPARKIPVQPIVLLFFNHFGDEYQSYWPQLAAWLDGTSSDEDYPDGVKKYVTEQKLSKRVAFNWVDGTNPQLLKDQLSYTTGNRVLAVAMNGCPDEVFRYFYSSATLPFVFEGAGTASLALNLGRPFLCSRPAGYPSLAFGDETPPLANTAMTAVEPLKKGVHNYNDANPDKWPSAEFGGALCDVMTDQRGAAYFTALKMTYGAAANDRLRMALRVLRWIPGFPA